MGEMRNPLESRYFNLPWHVGEEITVLCDTMTTGRECFWFAPFVEKWCYHRSFFMILSSVYVAFNLWPVCTFFCWISWFPVWFRFGVQQFATLWEIYSMGPFRKYSFRTKHFQALLPVYFLGGGVLSANEWTHMYKDIWAFFGFVILIAFRKRDCFLKATAGESFWSSYFSTSSNHKSLHFEHISQVH